MALWIARFENLTQPAACIKADTIRGAVSALADSGHTDVVAIGRLTPRGVVRGARILAARLRATGRRSTSIEVEGSAHLTWMYPDIYEARDHLEISLCHVRAAKNIRLRYDSERDGWVIEMEKTYEEIPGECICYDPPQHVEVGFVGAWDLHEEAAPSDASSG